MICVEISLLEKNRHSAGPNWLSKTLEMSAGLGLLKALLLVLFSGQNIMKCGFIC